MSGAAPLLSSDMRDLLGLLIRWQVQFLVVGAHAVNSYTEARMTKDLDLWVNPTPENAKRVIAALSEFGAPLDTSSEHDFCDRSTFIALGCQPNRIDILKAIPGIDFQPAWERRRVLELEGLQIPVPDLEDLLASKLAGGRPQDLLNAAKLRKALELEREQRRHTMPE